MLYRIVLKTFLKFTRPIDGAGLRFFVRRSMVGIVLWGLLGMTASQLLRSGTQAATSIGAESVLRIPASARFSSIVNFRPGDGDTVSNNPPYFSWMYNTNHIVSYEFNPNGFGNTIWFWTNSFQLQVASNATFTGNLQTDVTLPFNYYAFNGPLDTSATRKFWWRVKYVRNGTPFWTNGPFNFTVAANASTWDRSFLASTNYVATNGVHPIFCFRAGEQAAIYSWMQTQPDFTAYGGVLSMAVGATNKAYFKSHSQWGTNPVGSNPNLVAPAERLAFDQVRELGCVLSLWALSGEERWTNASMTGWLVTNLNHFVNWYQHPANNYTATDYGHPAGTPDIPLLLAATYDWMYDYMGADTATFNGQLRTNTYGAIWKTWQIINHSGAFWTDTENGNPPAFPPTYGFPRTTESVPTHSFMKLPHSHWHTINFTVMPMALVVANDRAAGEFTWRWMMNYLLSRTSPYAGFAAQHAGPYGYSDGQTFKQAFGNGIIGTMMFYDVAFPQAQLYRTEFLQRFPEWFTRLHPYGMRHAHGPYGDGWPAPDYGHSGLLGRKTYGLDMAGVARSGVARQAYELNAEFHAATSVASWTDLPLRWHYKDSLPALKTNTTSAVYVEDGYVAASSKSPSEFDCYTNGVGFSMRARPRGSLNGHDVYTDGSVDMWAYGAQLTDGGGAGLDQYGYRPESSPTLFVNGLGQSTPGYLASPDLPIAASISAFTNSGTNFVFVSADITGLFTNSAHPLSGLVTKVRRHILFPRSMYWVICDEFGSRSPATFAFRWHVPWVFRYSATGGALERETFFANGLYGSNSLAMTTNGFTYVAANYTSAGAGNYVPPRIPIHVAFVNATNQYGIFNAVGVNNLGAGGVAKNGTSDTNSTLNPFISGGTTYGTPNPDRAVGMWVTNRVPATSWRLITVIVPQQTGVPAPVITRLDESTVAVTYEGMTETITFDANYQGPFTYRVDLGSLGKNPPSPPARNGRQPDVINP